MLWVLYTFSISLQAQKKILMKQGRGNSPSS
jgi:hypothetical protein